MKPWQEQVCIEAGADGLPIAPAWSADGQPICDDRCPFHDGKRCSALGFRPAHHCEPAIVEMALLITSKRRAAR